MMRPFRFAPVVAAILALAACAPAQRPDPRSLITPAQIAAVDQPLLLSGIESLGGGTLIVAGQRDGVVTWRTADNVTLSYRDGLLVATRGLPEDVMSADVAGTRAALAGGPRADYPRFVSYLGPDDETLFRAFRCTMQDAGPDPVQSFGRVFPATLLRETCYSTGLTVENRYWVAPGGGIRRSFQWLGPELGSLETEQLSEQITE